MIMSVLLKLAYSFNVIRVKNLRSTFFKIYQTSTHRGKSKGITKTILKKKKVGRITLSYFKTSIKTL